MSSFPVCSIRVLTPILGLAIPMGMARTQALPTVVYSARPTCLQGVGVHPGLSTRCDKWLATGAVGAPRLLEPESVKETQWIKGMIIGGAIGAAAFGALMYVLCSASDTGHDCVGGAAKVGLLGAFVGGVTGALIGGAFSKPPPQRPETAQGH
jgi:hypothetical protein